MSTAMPIGQTTIAGQACFVIEDHIAPTLAPDTIHIAEIETSSIACPLLEITQRRQQTDLPIYGVWQILFASNKLQDLDWSKDYYIRTTDSSGQSKHLFVYKTDQDQITTGDLEEADSKNAIALYFDTQDLVLPEQAIKTMSESTAEQNVKRKATISFAILCIFASIVTYFASYSWLQNELGQAQAMHQQLVQEKDALHESLARQKQLSKSYVFSILHPVAYLRQYGIPMRADSIVFSETLHRIIIHDHYDAEDYPFTNLVNIEHHQNGYTTISYQ